MTEKKHVAKSLKSVLDNSVMQVILDRSKSLADVIPIVQDFWDFDMFTRKPGPALRDGIFVGTDLDLACFMSAIASRGAVINIPKYKGMRPQTLREGERVISPDNRHGPILGLVSNKELFSFSVKINDMNVVTTDSVGKPRTYTLTDPSGDWYDGWQCVEWDPSIKENAFLAENDIWTDNKVIFSNFAHPNRWTSLYGQYYFITKALIQRMSEECQWMFGEMKAMLKEGIEFPTKGDGAKKTSPETFKKEGKSVTFDALEVEVDVPLINDFPQVKHDQLSLINLDKLRSLWTYTLLPSLRFPARVTELAFFQNGYKDGKERLPSWLSGGTKWEREYTPKGKRVKWDRLVIAQPGVGETAISIRKRVKEKATIMDMDYKGGK